MPSVGSIDLLFKDQTMTLRIGDWIKLSREGANRNLGRAGDRAQAVRIVINQTVGDNYFHLVKERWHPNWGNLNGSVAKGKGIEIYYYDLMKWFDLKHEELQVAKDFFFKKKNLKGMSCKVLASLEDNEIFIEMDEDVRGGSCDGLGKRGHCIIIKENLLATKAETKQKTADKRRRKR